MPFLLDTCAAMWIVDDLPIKASALTALNESGQKGEPVFISPITGWEIGLLAMKGKFRSRYAPLRWLENLLSRPHVQLAELPPHVLLQSCFLPGVPPREPSDRIIAATAREYGLTVMTRDRELLAFGAEGHIAVEPC